MIGRYDRSIPSWEYITSELLNPPIPCEAAERCISEGDNASGLEAGDGGVEVWRAMRNGLMLKGLLGEEVVGWPAVDDVGMQEVAV